jgi:secondary thiamine-phosphate synthase enzyme
LNIFQQSITLREYPRGFHLITREIESSLQDLDQISRGIAHIHILHTSASLCLNENADPDVRRDMESIFSFLVPENHPSYVHTYEGPDDMPAHGKTVLIGSSLTLPVSNGRFILGTWQGVYLGEHRDHGGRRKLFITLMGE